MKDYYTLIAREKPYNKYVVVFGDYDKEAVQYEKMDYKGHDEYEDVKLIKTKDNQSCIDNILTKMNKR